MTRMTLAILTLALTALAAPGRAHHSFAATYDESQTVKIEGRLVQFLYRNPHSFVHLMAPDASGQERRWAVEWGAAGQLAGEGITRETLKPGDVVAITGNPSRNPGEYRIRMMMLRRPADGFSWGNQPGQTVD